MILLVSKLSVGLALSGKVENEGGMDDDDGRMVADDVLAWGEDVGTMVEDIIKL